MSESGNGGKQLDTTTPEKKEEVTVTSRVYQRNYEPWPMDFLILEKLPDKGLLGGVHWKGRRVRDLVEEFSDELGKDLITTGAMTSRLKEMKKEGFTVDLPGNKGSKIWAKTPEGRAFMGKKEEYLGRT